MLDPITDWNLRCQSADPNAPGLAARFEREGSVCPIFRVRLARGPGTDIVRYVRTYLHNRLWAVGAQRVVVDCERELFNALRSAFEPGGAFHHQAVMMSRVYGKPFEMVHAAVPDRKLESDACLPRQSDPRAGRHIGVDLGGSDAKVVALNDGELRHCEKRDWNPRELTRGEQALEAVEALVKRAVSAAGLGRIDGIGISTAGIVVRDRVVVSGIFGGLPPEEFDGWIGPMGAKLSDRFGRVPTCVAHDGDMTPLWAYVNMGLRRVLGLSLGTGLGGGFVDERGQVSGMLCELGKVILDMSPDAPKHVYNKTRGPALHYCSQNAVFRLAEEAGIALDRVDMLAEKLRRVQALVERGDGPANEIFKVIGRGLAVAVAEFHDYFGMDHVVLVGRVMAGRGGEVLLASAADALGRDFPEVAAKVELHVPDSCAGIDRGTSNEFGQAIASAYLSSMRAQGCAR